MELRTIPNTDLYVSPLCLGTMTFGTPVAEADAIALTHRALDLGVNFLDTANMYEGYKRYIGSPGGVAEEILGKALKGKRDQVVVATKVGMKVGPANDDQGLSRGHVLREIDRSLKRLGCDHVDLYYMHKPDPDTPVEESIRTFDDLIDAGKVRYWALSNFSAEQISNLLKVCDENSLCRPVALQAAYSLLKCDIETEVLPLCQKEQIAVLPYQVLQGGMLTGKYRRGENAPKNSRLLEKPEWTMPLNDETFDKLEQIEVEAQKMGCTLFEHALRYPLEQLGVVSLVVSIKKIDQLKMMLDAIDQE
jgi:aryl-alcohol dehydrogenase-like predicted oxidoreductase